MPNINYRIQALEDCRVFYREAGDPNAPTLLLLHGFPSSSHMFRNLIPLMAEHFHVIAPDLPGFGFTSITENGLFDYTFNNLANITQRFIDALGLSEFAMYVFDYGAPVGFRLALNSPRQIKAIITQNGNAYEEGLSPAWDPIQTYWRNPSTENRNNLKGFLSPQTTRWQYEEGVEDLATVAPDGYTFDAALFEREGTEKIQLDLFLDYATNVALYPEFQKYFQKEQPPLLAVWGNKDPFFLAAGAEAFKKDIHDAEINFYNTGHFALETHCEEIASTITSFLNRKVF